MRSDCPRDLGSRAKERGVFVSLAACACALLLGGCFGAKRPTPKVVNVSFAHPIVPADVIDASPDSPPEIPFDVAPLPSFGSGRTVPARPRVATPPPSGPAPEKAAAPLILPEMSAEEMAAARSETQQSLDAADGNLTKIRGKSLNPAQKDLESKVRGFMETARAAMKNGDLPRARDFAKKAEVLARELAAGF